MLIRILAAAALAVVNVEAGAAESASAEYTVVHGWPVLPEGEMLGQVTGIGVDSSANVWVFHRAGREWAGPMPKTPIQAPTIWVFDGRSGRLLRSMGAGRFVMPHGLTVDAQNNVWVTDVALHQVFKLSPDGELLLKLGKERSAGADKLRFNRPTDVAVLPDGAFYVSDGYINTRVVKFSAAGEYVSQWGARGAGPGQFDLPHGIAVDEQQRVYVADRNNARIQRFDALGNFIDQWKSMPLGRPYAVAVGPDGVTFAVDGGDQPDAPPDRSGLVVLDSDGRIRERIGRFGNYDGQFRLAHDVAVSTAGEVYVADAWGQRVQKFVRK